MAQLVFRRMELRDEKAYRDAIAELQRLTDHAAADEPREARRQELIAAIEAYAQKSGPDARKGRPHRSIPTD